jgi:hypothetical protein
MITQQKFAAQDLFVGIDTNLLFAKHENRGQREEAAEPAKEKPSQWGGRGADNYQAHVFSVGKTFELAAFKHGGSVGRKSRFELIDDVLAAINYEKFWRSHSDLHIDMFGCYDERISVVFEQICTESNQNSGFYTKLRVIPPVCH